MSKQILVNASHYETRVATLENGEIRQLHIEREEDRNVVGNVYKGVVKRVLPGMQAAFLELGLERTAFLYVDDIIDEPLGTDVDYLDEFDEGRKNEEDGETEAYLEGGDDPAEGDDVEVQVNAPKETEGRQAEAEEDEKPPLGEEDSDGSDDDDGGPQGPGGRMDRAERRIPRDEERGDRPPRDDDRGNRPRDDDRGARAPREDDRGRGPRDDDRGARGPRDDDRGARGPRDEDRSARGPRDDDRGGRGPGRGPREDDRSARGPRNDDRHPRRDSRRPQRGGGGGGGPRRRFGGRRPRERANIQDLLTEGQEILVQVAKAPIGTKGARLTTHISLPGRNLVLMPTVRHLGISRRIDDDRERRRLRDMFTKRIRPHGVGFIIRTVAGGKSYRDLKADADYLVKTWTKIQRESKRKRAPALIHEDMSLTLRAVRDFFTDDVDAFVIDNPEEYENVQSFITQFMPRLQGAVKLFKGPSQLFEHYGIEAEISRALGKKVWLKSGGYLLIDQSEALTSVDVNTGRYVGSKSLEETIFRTNLEAVKEIAYQLRIRNVGGIIIIDLIDMETLENREKVYRALQEALSEDKSKTNILKISELGLVEMTRKRTHEDLVRYLTESCSNCDGRGYHKSRRTICFEIFREVEKEATSPMKNIVVFANPEVVGRLSKEERVHVEQLQTRFNKIIDVKPDPAFHVEQFEVYGK